MMGGLGFFITPTFTTVTTIDVGNLTEGNLRLRKQLLFFEAMSRNVVMIVLNILVGWLLDQGKYFFI